jgi:hypothetical protein
MRRRLTALLAVTAFFSAAPAFSQSVQQFGQILILPCSTPLLVQIDTALSPVLTIQLTIDKLTDADRRIFVDVDANLTLQRMVVIQYESVIAGANFKFVYPPKPPAVFGDNTYRFGAYVYNDEEAAANAPEREAGRTRALLTEHGVKMPRLMRTARLARVADPDGLSEVIIFYMENADADYPAGPLRGADEDGDLPLDSFSRRVMLERLKSAVHQIAG